MLKDKPKVWNRWKSRNPKVVPDLSGARLNDYRLRGGNFSACIFLDADLRMANASGADSNKAKLVGVALQRAKFARANFSRANLRDADLSGPNLRGCDLTVAILAGGFVEAEQLATARSGEPPSLEGSTSPDLVND